MPKTEPAIASLSPPERVDLPLAEAGARMLGAFARTQIGAAARRKSITRTRPAALLDRGDYRFGGSGARGHTLESLLSRHAACVVAGVRAAGRISPKVASPPFGAALTANGLKDPYCAGDVTAGAARDVLGVAAVDAAFVGQTPHSYKPAL